MLWKHLDANLLASGQFLECLSEDLGHGKKQNRTRLNLYCSTLKLDLYQEDIEFVPYPYETKVSLRGVHFLEISSLLLGTPTRHFEPVQLDVIGRLSCFSGYVSFSSPCQRWDCTLSNPMPIFKTAAPREKT